MLYFIGKVFRGLWRPWRQKEREVMTTEARQKGEKEENERKKEAQAEEEKDDVVRKERRRATQEQEEKKGRGIRGRRPRSRKKRKQ